MAKWWKEVWSAGSGARRLYCGIARTVDGYAVDLFRGDECIASDLFATRTEAERAASGLRREHVRRSSSSSRLRRLSAPPNQQSGPRAVA
jgi:hypothetical protein